MHVRHLTVADFRSYASADLALSPGISTLVGLMVFLAYSTTPAVARRFGGSVLLYAIPAAGAFATLPGDERLPPLPAPRNGEFDALVPGIAQEKFDAASVTSAPAATSQPTLPSAGR